MWSISKKDISQIFSNLSGYIAIILFLLVNGIFLFFLKESSILTFGFASLDKFFELAPWVLLFMVPALTMRSVSDELRSGTIEILKTRPLSGWQIVVGKYVAVLLVLLFVILPTLVYVYTIHSLSASGNIDLGGIAGSYIGLYLLAAVFAAISLCCGSFTSNAVIAFLVSAFACLVLYFGFAALGRLPALQGNFDYYIEMMGIDFHYHSISRGVIDSRDIIYFFSIIFLSLLITVKNLQRKK